MVKTAKGDLIQEGSVKLFTEKFKEPVWLSEPRFTAWQKYAQLPMPTTRDEEWRKTDISGMNLEDFQLLSVGEINAANTKKPRCLECLEGGFGQFAASLYGQVGANSYLSLNQEAKEKGVILAPLPLAISQNSAIVEKYIKRSFSGAGENNKFELLNRALYTHAYFVYVPENVELKDPIAIANGLSDLADDIEYAALLPRIIVVAGAFSKFSLVNFTGYTAENSLKSKSVLFNQITEIFVEDNAKLTYLEVQENSKKVTTINRTICNVQRDASFDALNVAIGGHKTKSDIAIKLNAPGAHSEISGLVLGIDDEHYNFNTIQEHLAMHTTSNIDFKVALKDEAVSFYQGIIYISEEAQKTEAHQTNKNLLLGSKAKADSIPKLEILADDVKCSHGATVGPVDKEQIFYLMSRGLSRAEAEELVVLGFFKQVLERFPMQGAVNWLEGAIGARVYK